MRRRRTSRGHEGPETGHTVQQLDEQTLNDVLSLSAEDVRGISLERLLFRNAELFADNGEMARRHPDLVFSFSRQVSTIDYFVSHSWTSSYVLKHIALLMSVAALATRKHTRCTHKP